MVGLRSGTAPEDALLGIRWRGGRIVARAQAAWRPRFSPGRSYRHRALSHRGALTAGKLPGGVPPLGDSLLRAVSPGFARRDPTLRRQYAQKYGGSDATETAVERGLEFLHRYQFPDGRWRFDAVPAGRGNFPESGRFSFRADTAATGLAVLAFLGDWLHPFGRSL